MVVAVDGAMPASVPQHPKTGRLGRLLRRGLIVATLAAAGWILAMIFAAPASAADGRETTGRPANGDATEQTDQAATRTSGHPSDRTADARQTGQSGDAAADRSSGAPTSARGDQISDQPAARTDEQETGRSGRQPAAQPNEDTGQSSGEPAEHGGEPPATRDPVRRHDTITELASGQPVKQAPVESAAKAEVPVASSRKPAGVVSTLLAPAGNLLKCATNTVAALNHTVVGLVDDAASALGPGLASPIVRLPDALLPGLTPGHEAVPAKIEAPKSGVEVSPAAPPAPAGHALPAAAAVAPERPAAAGPSIPIRMSHKQSHGDQTAGSGPGHRPGELPVAPLGGTTVSTAHDDFDGARGGHGMLASQASLTPPSAGFTTRSRAADGTGRIAGLPATTPD